MGKNMQEERKEEETPLEAVPETFAEGEWGSSRAATKPSGFPPLFAVITLVSGVITFAFAIFTLQLIWLSFSAESPIDKIFRASIAASLTAASWFISKASFKKLKEKHPDTPLLDHFRDEPSTPAPERAASNPVVVQAAVVENKEYPLINFLGTTIKVGLWIGGIGLGIWATVAFIGWLGSIPLWAAVIIVLLIIH